MHILLKINKISVKLVVSLDISQGGLKLSGTLRQVTNCQIAVDSTT